MYVRFPLRIHLNRTLRYQVSGVFIKTHMNFYRHDARGISTFLNY